MANTKVKAEQLDLSDAVDIGIGIATPAAELHVNSTGENINLRLTRDTNNGIILTGTDGTNPAFRVSTIASGTATERLVLNTSGLYPYTDVGLELGDSNNRWNRLEVKSTTSGNIHFEGVDTSAGGSFKTFELTSTFSGSDATGTDIANYGIYNQVDSSATGGDTSDEHRVYGMRNQVTVTGDSDIIYGNYNRAEAEHSSGQVSLLYGNYNYAVGDPNSGGTISNMYASYNLAQSQGASGSTITNVYAGYNKVLTSSGDDIGHASLSACYAEIETDDSGQENTITDGYLYRALYDDDSGNNTKYTNFYGLHIGGSSLSGNMTGSGDAAGIKIDLAGLDYGLYIMEDITSYFAGKVGIGSMGHTIPGTTGLELNLSSTGAAGMALVRRDSTINANNNLGNIFFGGTEDSGSTVNYAASIEAFAGGAHSASDSEGYLLFKTTPNSSTTLTERMRINTDGDLQVGRTSGATDHGIDLYHSGHLYLYVNGTGNTDGIRLYDSGGNIQFTVDCDGDVWDDSDERKKENIVDAPSALGTISDIEVRSFNWKLGGRKQTYGFIAQELNEVTPELVRTPKEDDDGWRIKPTGLIPMLTKAIQEQQTQIEALQAEVKALKGG